MSINEDYEAPAIDPLIADAVDRIASTEAPAEAVQRFISTINSNRLGPVSNETNQLEVNNMTATTSNARNTSWVRSPALKWTSIAALAAGVLVALGVVFSPSPNQGSLFAKMQQALLSVQSIQCETSFFRPGEEQAWKTSTYYINEPNQFREERITKNIGLAINVFDLANGRYGMWWPENGKAMTGNLTNVDELAGMFDLFIGMLRNANEEDAEQIDRYERDGVWFVEYEYLFLFPGGEDAEMVNVVVEEAMALPVEITFYDSQDNVSRTFTNLIFNEAIDDALFVTEPPEGYEITEQDQGPM